MPAVDATSPLHRSASAYKLAANRIGNVALLFLTFIYAAFYIVAMVEKWIVQDDKVSDILKLILVIINFLSFGSCLYLNYEVLLHELRFLRVVEALTIPILIVLCINSYMLNQQLQDIDTWFNVDYLTLSLTLLLDLLFLYLYVVFRNLRSLIITALVVVIEVIIFIVASFQGNDDVIDTANLTVTIISAALSVIFWTGRLSIESGETRFKDYFELKTM